MKYYHKTMVIREGTPNEYVCNCGYNINDIPLDKPVYGFAYKINDDTEHHRLMCKPILGCVTPNGYGGGYFYPYKVGTHEKKEYEKVNFKSRMYADTYKEAVEMFNELVQNRIDGLNKMVEKAKSDFIKTTT